MLLFIFHYLLVEKTQALVDI